MKLTGRLLIGENWQTTSTRFSITSPLNNQTLGPVFHGAEPKDIAAACELSMNAFSTFSCLPLSSRSEFLNAIADEILELGDTLIERAHQESGLPVSRLQGERGRTIGQLKLFAEEVLDGAWLGLRLDSEDLSRSPMPRASHRMMNIPVGPVAVFGASNFPLAFSVAGGDTAAALAAGCPVVVKAHPAHPGTSELIAGAILKAAQRTNIPNGVFSLLHGTTNETGTELVRNPHIKAVGFTGSRQGGLALMKVAAERDEPIPVYAEMSAINPVILLPGVLESDPEGLASAFVGSLTMGAGQFCTNPGLVLAVKSPSLDVFKASVVKGVQEVSAQTMLTTGIHQSYCRSVDELSSRQDIRKLTNSAKTKMDNGAVPAFFETSAIGFSGHDERAQEVFGPSSILVVHENETELISTLTKLEGQLTASLHFVSSDLKVARSLIPVLQNKVGRIIANGWPTGVEVCHAMVHGGPFPATSDGRTTSVGTLAIDRFLRPVCYQNFPDELLPDAIQPASLSGKLRRLDGIWLTD